MVIPYRMLATLFCAPLSENMQQFFGTSRKTTDSQRNADNQNRSVNQPRYAPSRQVAYLNGRDRKKRRASDRSSAMAPRALLESSGNWRAVAVRALRTMKPCPSRRSC